LEDETIEYSEEQINYHGHLDDGRDWTHWLVWRMKEKCRIRMRVIELPPERPQVVPPQRPPKKKQRRRKK
jgi:hypothetical protein